ELQIPIRTAYTTHTFHQYTLRVKEGKRDALHRFLAEKEIPSMIYYPVPAHEQKMFEKVKDLPKKLPITNQLTKEVLSLPIHTELEEEQLEYITQNIKRFFYN